MNLEKKIIFEINKSFKISSKNFDDCSLINKNTVISVDTYCDKTHFDTEYFPFYYIGYRTVIGAISDIYANNGLPKYILISAGIPENLKFNNIKKIIKGIKDALAPVKIKLIGGDTVKSQYLFLNYTVIGKTNKNISRNNFKHEDFLFITNSLGKSFIGFKKLKKKNIIKNNHFLKPQLPYKHYSFLRKNIKYINSIIDISDGLYNSLLDIMINNNNGFSIELSKINLEKYLIDFASKEKINPYDIFLSSAEEYELLFSIKQKYINEFYKKLKNSNLKFTYIGRCIKQSRILFDNKYNIKKNKLIFNHFKK